MIERKYILVAVETAHIQSYIFASNRLRENVGASYLVAAATGKWALQSVKALKVRTNLTVNRSFNDQHIESGDIDVEVLYSGGGNFVALFADDKFTDEGELTLLPDSIARRFIRKLSRKVQLKAPGLKLTFNAKPFQWSESLSEAVSDVLEAMKRQRSMQPALRGDAGLGVQIMCASTSMPAVMDKETRSREAGNNPWLPYSAETLAKREAFSKAHDLLDKTLLGETIDAQSQYTFALKLDDLGRSEGDTSYIAVVHADGNGLGLLIQGLKERFPADKNREYINYMREFSEGVKEVAQKAQQEMIQQLVSSIDEIKHHIEGIGPKTQAIELKQHTDGKFILPIRPLVSGGDDVTFVCDGRIGLDLAVTFLSAFEKHSQKILPTPLTACAGIAIVKSHYPFAQAYDLAEELTSNAKQARHAYDEHKAAPSAIDWHVTAGGLYGDLEVIREREYQVAEGSLTLRPLFVSNTTEVSSPLYQRSWTMVQRILTEFQQKWRSSQNKAERLREALRKGKTETSIFKLRYLSDSQSPSLPQIDGILENGWLEINGKNYCIYYDALELLDKYIPLKTQKEEPASQ